MPKHRKDVLQGTLSLLVLQTLDRGGPLHGYAITAAIHHRSHDLLRVEEGSLYPALRRMEQEGWLSAAWGKTEKNRQARFYSVTPAGRRQLEKEKKSWARLSEGVRHVLQHA
ncbi:MAG: PadR family transcriptional regulator [Thermoanaerobaculia bacterium]|nr:PadR family transcriptional regulator [Thermoanaerobaculia bacterium]